MSARSEFARGRVCVCVCVCPGWPRSHCFLCSHPEFRQGWSEELLGSSTFTTTIIPASDPAVSLSLRVPWGVRQHLVAIRAIAFAAGPVGLGQVVVGALALFSLGTALVQLKKIHQFKPSSSRCNAHMIDCMTQVSQNSRLGKSSVFPKRKKKREEKKGLFRVEIPL